MPRVKKQALPKELDYPLEAPELPEENSSITSLTPEDKNHSIAQRSHIITVKLSKQELYKKCIEAIENDINILSFSDVCCAVRINYRNFFLLFPEDSEERENIYSLLEQNKNLMKQEIRKRLLVCKSPAALIALYKLLATREEREALMNVLVKDYTQNNQEVQVTLT